MDVEENSYVDLPRETTYGLVRDAARFRVNVCVNAGKQTKVLTCALGELLPFRSKSHFAAEAEPLLALSQAALERVDRRLMEVRTCGLMSLSAADALQVLSGTVPDVLKRLSAPAAPHAEENSIKSVLESALAIALEWLKVVPKLNSFAERLTPECVSSDIGFALVSLFPEVSFMLQTLLGLSARSELQFEQSGVKMEYLRYRAVKYSHVSVVNRMRAGFLEASGFDSILQVLASSSEALLRFRLVYLPVLTLHLLLAPSYSEAVFRLIYEAARKVSRLDYSALRRSPLLATLQKCCEKHFTDYPSDHFWKTVAKYARMLLHDEHETVSFCLNLLQRFVDCERMREVVREDLLSVQEDLLKLYVNRSFRQRVFTLFCDLLRSGVAQPSLAVTVSRGATYLHLLHGLATISIETRAFDFLALLASQNCPISKLGPGTEIALLEAMLQARVPPRTISSLVSGLGDEKKLALCIKHRNFDLIERISVCELRSIREPRKKSIAIYALVTRKRLKLVWVMKKSCGRIPKTLQRDIISSYAFFAIGSNEPRAAI